MLPESIHFRTNDARQFTPDLIDFLISDDRTNKITGAIEREPNEHGAHLISKADKQEICDLLNAKFSGKAKADARLAKARDDYQAKLDAETARIARIEADRIKAEQDAEAARNKAAEDAAKGKAKA